MSYRLELEESFVDGVRRIGREQSDKALQKLESLEDLEDDIHATRKHCKKLRGLIRLVRPAMEKEYQLANEAFRDAARELAPMRDAHALLDTFDDMVSISATPPSRLETVRTALEDDSAQATERNDIEQRVERAHELITAGASRIPSWQVDDPLDAIEAGVRKTYKRGRNRLTESVEDGRVEDRHQWRKRVKYGWYHLRLVRNATPSVLGSLARAMHDLSDALGDDHDLGVLRARIESDPGRYGDDQTVEATLRLTAGWQFALQRRALSLGRRLYVETPKRFSQRLAGYLRVWREHGAELEAGELDDVWDPVDLA